MVFGHYVRRRGLEQLKHYKYSSGSLTAFDKQFNKWWELVVKFVPMWVSPNVLTLIGFISALTASILVLCYSPNLSEPAPRIVYLITGALLFAYQTLDAIDGKQARRTGNSSPLGQLFDHGCDIILATAISICTLGVTLAGTGFKQYAVVVVSTQIPQFIYVWWEYHFHIFYSSTGPIGVTEAQTGMFACCGLAYYFGPEIFGMNLLTFLPSPVLNVLETLIILPRAVNMKDILIYLLLIMNSLLALINVYLGIAKASRKLSAIVQLSSFFAFQYVQWLLYDSCLLGPLHFPSYMVYFVITTSYSIMGIRLLLSATCKIHFNPLQWPLIPFYACTFSICYIVNFGYIRSVHYPLYILKALCFWNAIYLMDLLRTSITDICTYLDISCFTITHKTPPEKKVS